MKKLITKIPTFITVVILLFMLNSCVVCGCNKHRYEIIDNGGKYYYTNEYIKDENGCIDFKNQGNNKKNKNIKICGNYTITENPNYKPENNW